MLRLDSNFIGGLCGPGCMYPQSVPADKLPGFMRDMRALRARLDLNALEVMENTEDHRRARIHQRLQRRPDLPPTLPRQSPIA